LSIAIARLDADTAAPEDVAALDRILTGARASIVRAGEHLDGAAERLSEAASDSERIVLVARLAPDGTIIGLADGVLGAGGLTIAAIAVDLAHRRRRVAHALLDAAAAAGSAKAGERVSVTAGVHSDNAAALAFFAAHGFVPSGTQGGVTELVRA